MRRREFLGALAGAAARPMAARAQQAGKVYRIGVLETTPANMNVSNMEALRQGLRGLNYVEGRNLVIEYRSADGRGERFPALATELLHLKVDVIVTRGTPAVLAAKNATTTVPVVMAAMGEPLMVVSSLAHPGGNVTGLSGYSTDLEAKRFEVLKEMVPGAARIAGLYNMGNAVVPPQWRELQKAAQIFGVQSQLLDVRKPEDIAPAFDAASRENIGRDDGRSGCPNADEPKADRRDGIEASDTDHLRIQRVRRCGRVDCLRTQLSRPLSPRSGIH